MSVLFTLISHNAKTGPIPVSMSTKATCPDSCPLKAGGCYASGGPINLHWQRLSKGLAGNALSWEDFCTKVSKLPRGQLWRHNQAGDLPGENLTIDRASLAMLVSANKGRNGFTYTHKPVMKGQADAKTVKANVASIADANAKGFIINLSADNLSEADAMARLGVAPVVTLLPSTQTTNTQTPEGRKVIVCPATYREGVNCATCRLCQNVKRSVIIGFPSHGVSIKKADLVQQNA